MFKFFPFHIFLFFIGLISPMKAESYAMLEESLIPDNPIAIGNCTATVKVDAARLRAEPSLDAKILGIKLQDSSLYVSKVCGKWVQVVLADGDTAFMAAYLLTFPAAEILEKWKKDAVPQTVGKKARVKWAKVNIRLYPSKHSPYQGYFKRQDLVGILCDLGNGWVMVESRDAEDKQGQAKVYGFVAKRSLREANAMGFQMAVKRARQGDGNLADNHFAENRWSSLAAAHGAPKKIKEPEAEGLGNYCARTAWTPELFALEMKQKDASEMKHSGEVLAFR